MPITSMDSLLAALPGHTRHFNKASVTTPAANRWTSMWRAPGLPGAANIPPTGNGEVPTRLTAGAILLPTPAPGSKLYLARFAAMSINNIVLVVYDRLWHNSGFVQNVTTPQTIPVPPTLTRGDTTGHNVELWGEVYGVSGGTNATYTVTYTNQNGQTGRTATYTKTSVTLQNMEMVPFFLQSGDTGVQTVHQLQLSASTGAAGDFGLVLMRRVAEIQVTRDGVETNAFVTCLNEIPENACLAVALVGNITTTGPITGALTVVEA